MSEAAGAAHITRLLREWQDGSQDALDRLVPLVYDELHALASRHMARNILGLTYLKTGDISRAVSELEAARRLSPGPRTISTLGFGYGAAGSRARAQGTLDELITLSKQRYTSAFAMAAAYAGIGDRDRALSQLEAAFDERSDTMAVARVYPVLDGLRDEPRFKTLLARVGSVPAR